MKNRIYAFLVAGLMVLGNPLHAREFNNLKFPDKVTLAGTNIELQLNGIGMRTKFVFDVYVGALYTKSAARTRDEVQAQEGPKRVLMHFVYDEVEAEKLVNGWAEGFEENQPEDALKKLDERLQKFNAMFTTVYAGDVILLDYVPGKGTIVKIKGEQKGVIEGEDFYLALLDVWLGDEPADDDLKEAMLGNDD
jgi:hypothetical protein